MKYVDIKKLISISESMTYVTLIIQKETGILSFLADGKLARSCPSGAKLKVNRTDPFRLVVPPAHLVADVKKLPVNKTIPFPRINVMLCESIESFCGSTGFEIKETYPDELTIAILIENKLGMLR